MRGGPSFSSSAPPARSQPAHAVPALYQVTHSLPQPTSTTNTLTLTMASSRDVRDIMNLGQAPTPQGPSMSTPVPQPKAKKQKRPEGITRELFALMGGNAPALALAQPVKPKFKERFKPKAQVGPASKWHWTLFSIPSRAEPEGSSSRDSKEDVARRGLRLGHWVRDLPADHEQGAPDHKFAKFNTTSGTMTYTEEEYEASLKGEQLGSRMGCEWDSFGHRS